MPYFSLDEPRSVTLVYNGDRVDPKPFVHVNATHGDVPGNLPSAFILKVRYNGANITFINGDTALRFVPQAGVALRLGGQFSASANGMSADSVYPVTIVVKADYGSSFAETSIASRIIVLNENNSSIARGWTIAGIQRLYPQGDGGALIAEGEGSATYFLKSGSNFVTPTGDFTSLSVSGSGTGTTYTRRYPDSTRVVFNYQGLMLSQRNRWGDSITVTYDGSLRPWLIKDPLGLADTLVYGSNGLQAIGDPRGRRTLVSVHSDSTLLAITDPDNVATTFGYDGSRRLSTVTDRRGNTVAEIGYHGWAGKVTSVTGPFVPVIGGTLVRPAASFTPWQVVSVPYASTTSTAFTPARADTVRATVTDAAGHVRRFTANSFSQPLQATGPLGDTVTTTYLTSGLVSAVTDRLGVAASYSYDATGFATSSTVAGVTTNARKHSVWANADSIWGAAVPSQFLFYGANGRVDRVRSAGTDTTTFSYDAHGRVTAAWDASWHLLRSIEYNGVNGNLSKDSIPGGRTMLYRYDQFGRLDSTLAPGMPWRVTTFDVLNRPTAVFDSASATPTTFSYDSLRVRTVTDPLSNVHQFSYDALGRLIVKVDALSRPDTFEYDVEGQLRRHRNRRGQAITFSYDDLHRLRSRTGGADGPDTTTYSGDARIVTAANAASSETHYLNATSRLPDSVRVSLIIPGAGTQHYQRRYAWRSNLQLDSVSVAGPSGTSFLTRRYGYHSARRTLDSLSFGGGWTVIARNNDGSQKSVRFPISGDSIFNFVAPGHEITRLRSSVGSPLDDFYHTDSLGRIDQFERPGHVRMYYYDRLGRLVRAENAAEIDSICTPAGDNGFSCYVPYDSARINTYDRLGNRIGELAETSSGTELWSKTGSYGAGNRITSFGGCGYTTDFDGNVTSRCSTTFVWSADNRLTAMVVAGDTIRFAYDVAGRVVRRDYSGVPEASFLWEGDNLQAELNAAGTTVRGEYSYYAGLDHLHAFAFSSGGLIYKGYAHTDAMHNVRGIANGVNFYRRYDFSEWGASLGDADGVPNPGHLDRVRWKGALLLGPEAGLYYMRNRWYEIATGRFLSEDPLGVTNGVNLYAFVNNNPIDGADPLGLSAECPSGWVKGSDGKCVPLLGGITGGPTRRDPTPQGVNADGCPYGSARIGGERGECVRDLSGQLDLNPVELSPLPERPRPITHSRLFNAAISCLEEHYGTEGLLQLGVAALGLPVVKSRGSGFLGGASSTMTLASYVHQQLGLPKASFSFRGTRRWGGMVGRGSGFVTLGFAVYDATTVGMCMTPLL